MEISVIIPVYNAALFLKKAVESALTQAEVGEVCIIEDGSTDDSFLIAEQLARENLLVKVYQHADHKNHGRSASRNLGVQKATLPLIAFLDADDYYLPGRFKQALQVLATNPTADGVYEAIGQEFYDEYGLGLSAKYSDGKDLTTVSIANISPEQLFFYLVAVPGQQFSIDGLVVKKCLIDKIGLFDIQLIQTEDTDFIWRLSLHGQLFPGSIAEPVAIRGLHQNNGVFNRTEARLSNHVLNHKWFKTMLQSTWSPQINWAFVRKKLESEVWHYTRLEARWPIRIAKALYLPLLCMRYPQLIGKLLRG